MNTVFRPVKQEIQVLQGRFDRADEQATELKLQVVELQLETVTSEQSLQQELSHLQVLHCVCVFYKFIVVSKTTAAHA